MAATLVSLNASANRDPMHENKDTYITSHYRDWGFASY